MKYVIKGNIFGFLCEDCTEPLYGIDILLYLPAQNNVLAATVANTKETFHFVNQEEAAARKKLLIATTKTDEKGNFEFSLDEKYANNAFDIDFVCGTVPRNPPKPPRKEPVQFHITTFLPQWRVDRQQESYSFQWQYGISPKWWCPIRGNYFDAWVICGQLNNCETGKPIANAAVTAWDADFLTDDYLGTAITDANGHFRIDYTTIDFKQTFLSPWINVETDPGLPLTFHSGPDVYFKASISGVDLITETSADARKNVGYCLCVKLCTNTHVGNPEEPFPSAWTGVGSQFSASYGVNPYDFDVNGYAGSAKYALSGAIRLTGQAALKTAAGNRIEYRFLVSNTTTNNGTPSPAIGNFTKIVGVTPNLVSHSLVSKLTKKFPTGINDEVFVYSDQADFDADGWFDVNNAIERALVNNGYAISDLSLFWVIDEDTLVSMNTAALTTALNVPINTANAGDVFPNGSKIPIEKVAVRFEIREVVNKATNTFNVVSGNGKTLNSMVINNNASFLKFSIKELDDNGDCAPITGILHAKYTVHHPHLQYAAISYHSNSNPTDIFLTDGFLTLSGNTNAAINAGNNNNLQVNSTPLARCTYAMTLYLQRRLHNGDSQYPHEEKQILFFYDV